MKKNIPFDQGDFVTIPNKNSIKGLKPELQVVHFWIAAHSDSKTKVSWPSFKTLAEECGMSKRSVMRSVQALVKLGLLAKEKRKDENQVWSSNLYTLLIKEPSDKTNSSDTVSVASDSQSPPYSHTVTRVVSDSHTNYNQLTITNELNNLSTYVDKLAKADKRKPEINEMFSLWHETIGYPITSKTLANRRACYNLIHRHGQDNLIKALKGVALAADDQFAPRIADFCGLQSRWNDLMMWGRKMQLASKSSVEFIS